MIVPMTAGYAKQISGWTYEDDYAIYSFEQDDETLKELLGGNYLAHLDAHGSLTGYFCFGKPAQRPTVQKDVYGPDALDIGLGMKPALCGRGYGYEFMLSGLDFAQTSFHANRLRLTVASFNTRAIRVYERIGFRPVSEVTHLASRMAFKIMTYTHQQQGFTFQQNMVKQPHSGFLPFMARMPRPHGQSGKASYNKNAGACAIRLVDTMFAVTEGEHA